MIVQCLSKYSRQPVCIIVAIAILSALLSACITRSPSSAPASINKPASAVNRQAITPKGDLSQALSRSSSISGKYTCNGAARFRHQVVGTGHCVSLIQHCSGAPQTRYWREGERVKGKNLAPGTVIATFRNGKYPNITGWHAAIYISQDDQGIWVWDQWRGKPVHRRLIRFKNGRGTPNNDGDAYAVVR